MITGSQIGTVCREIREEYNMTQDDVANKAGVTRQSVYSWENGKCNSFKLLMWWFDFYPELMKRVQEKYNNNTGAGSLEMLLFLILVFSVVIFFCRG